jgi:putative transposase
VLVDYRSLTVPGLIGSLYIYEPPKAQEMRKQPMNEHQSLSHTVWDCKYHIVCIPKYRKKSLFKELRQYVGTVLKDLAVRKECKIEEGHLLANHVHILISILPKYSVSQVVGFIKGKSAISIARNYMGRRKNFTGQSFWARGYHVSTVGRDEEVIRNYIRHQESEDRRIDQPVLSGSQKQAPGFAGGI